MTSILIVDDSRVARMFVGQCMKIAGFDAAEFRYAEHGVAGLAKLREEPADLVITDLNMPEMDGETFLKEAKADPELKDTTFFVVSSLATEPRALTLIAAGAAAVLAKPIAPDKLSEALAELEIDPDPDAMDPVHFKLLVHSTEDAFRGLTFTSLEKAAGESDQWDTTNTVWASLTTASPVAADVTLRAPRRLLSELFLDAVPDATEPSDDDLGEFLAETLNILAGTWLGCIQTDDDPTSMGLPRCGIGLKARRAGTETQEFALGGEHIALDARPLRG